MPKNKQWYTIKNEAGETPELFIFDYIDDWFGVSAQSVVDEIKDIKASDIHVRINSPGGMVFEGIAIYNALRMHKANVHVSIEGLAASIASVIAMAGDTITIAENALFMIHNPYGWASGDAEAMRKTADVMDKITDSIAVSYTARTGKSLEEMKAIMTDETWYSAAEALEAGLVDQIDEPIKAAASFDLSRFRNAPDGFGIKAEEEKPDLQPEKNETVVNVTVESNPSEQAIVVATLCNEAGYPEKTSEFLTAKLSEQQVKAKLADFKTIQAICAAAKHSDIAADFIKANKSPDAVRNELFALLTQEDKAIDNSLSPDQIENNKEQPVIDTQAIYRKRNQA